MSRPIVIIAAGMGSRIKGLQGDLPKPLIELAGMSLIERTMKSAKAHGFDTFIIVVGYQAEVIQNALGDGSQWGVQITYVHNSDWQKKNGVSVLQAGREITTGEFVLLMADHVLDAAFFSSIDAVDMGEDELVLLTDGKIDTIFDMDDATKVFAEGDYISQIGKEISSFNCIDTGVFVISHRFFALLDSYYQEHGDVSLSEGVQALVDRKKARIHDVGDLWWQDVDTEDAFVQAEKILSQ